MNFNDHQSTKSHRQNKAFVIIYNKIKIKEKKKKSEIFNTHGARREL